MGIVYTMSIGEVLVGFGTILLAIIAFWSIMATRRDRKREAERTYKLRLLDNIQNWLKQIYETIDEKVYDPKTWVSSKEYFKVDNVLKQLLHLHGMAIFDRSQASQIFKKYQFEQKAGEYSDSFGKFTDKLHDGVEPKLRDNFTEDYAYYETEFLNQTAEFTKYIINIRIKEKL